MVKTTRRDFMKLSAAAGTAIFVTDRGRVFAQSVTGSPTLKKFVQPLPLFGVDIPLAQGGGSLLNPNTVKDRYGADFYRIVLGQYSQRMHPQLRPTRLWGYADATRTLPRFQYLGSPILAQKGVPVRANFINLLPPIHPLPVDTTIPGAETGQHVNRAAIHLHGGRVPWVSDGGPFHWFTPNGMKGPSVVKWLPDAFGRPTDDYWYPNDDAARFMWYHDHAVGITRLNAYAGLATGYILTDPEELASGLPLAGIVLVLQDKTFKKVADRWGLPGDLWYPHIYDAEVGDGGKPLPNPSCVPEFFGDTTVINGAVCPYLVVKPTTYRFRLLNGSQSRFYNLRLFKEVKDGAGRWTGRVTNGPALSAQDAVPGPDFLVIGSEGGFLPSPAPVSSAAPQGIEPSSGFAYHLLLGPGERSDVLIDFSGVANGTRFILYNDAPGPFPMGDPPVDALQASPDTANLLEVIVSSVRGLDDPLFNAESFTIPTVAQTPLAPSDPAPFVKSLHEDFDAYGRLIQLIGDGTPHAYLDRPTEIGRPGEVQVWDVYNDTGDTHPLHFHLFNVQVVGRATFSAIGSQSNPTTPTPDSGFTPPDPNEQGWKETVRMNPTQVTRVRGKFDHPPTPVKVPDSPRFPGHFEYVWHCHILEHEEHDMMRPLLVTKT
jgi:spore coat protein A, manganese oxidase